MRPRLRAASLLGCVSATALLALAAAGPAGAVVARDDQAGAGSVTIPSMNNLTVNNVPAAALVDKNNLYSYVGRLLVDLQPILGEGYGGSCTGTLINPRFYITAAHCVNDYAAERYGVGGDLRAGVSFAVAPNANSAALNWLAGQANTGYVDVVDVQIHPSNIEFQQADIAILALKTPVTNVGFGNLLISPVDQGSLITMVGYGRTGSGTSGGTVNSTIRRVGENTLGLRGSIDDLILTLFGETEGLPQTLYWADFDDPTYVTQGQDRYRANPYDFDLFPGAAVPNEAVTAQGDSGGPLFATINGQKVQIGVLSGGYRFFRGQEFGAYGTASFWQPAYLYANWIAQNNPYRYMGAKAGTFTWGDKAAWTEYLDPAFVMLADGKLVNALPATDLGATPTNPQGTINDGSLAPAAGKVASADVTSVAAAAASSTITLTANTDATRGKPQIAEGAAHGASPEVAEGAAQASPTTAEGQAQGPATAVATPIGLEVSKFEADNSAGTQDSQPVADSAAMAAPTIPGIISAGPTGSVLGNFNISVPNNDYGTVLGTLQNGLPNVSAARFYDVRLANATDLTVTGNTAYTIDRLNLVNQNARLTVAQAGRLTMEIGAAMTAGTLAVNGTFAPNLYLQTGGTLTGTGTIQTNGALISGGAVIPGSLTSVGTLTIAGNTAFGSQSLLVINAGAGNTFSRLNVTGSLTLGGALALNALNGYIPTYGQTLAVVAATNGIDGNFSSSVSNIGVLVPTIRVANGVATAMVDALPYAATATPSSQSGKAFAKTLDAARAGNYTALKGVYDSLDPRPVNQLGAALDSLAPDVVGQAQSNARAQMGFLAKGLGSRINAARNGAQGVTMAGLAPKLMNEGGEGRAALLALQNDPETQAKGEAREKLADLKEGYGLFFDLRHMDGDGRLISGRKSDLSNTQATIGLDKMITDKLLAGVAFTYGWGDSTDKALGAKSDNDTYAASAYGSYFDGQFFAESYLSVGKAKADTSRVALGSVLKGDTDGTLWAGGGALGFDHYAGAVGIQPFMRYDFASAKFGAIDEKGGAAALRFDSNRVSISEWRLGTTLYSKLDLGDGMQLRPQLTASYVRDFNHKADGARSASFAAAPTVIVNGLATTPRDRDWVELSGGLDLQVSDMTSISLSYEATDGRDDLKTHAYVGSVRIRF
ncbi:autotransporter domain-containing protein [Oleisolibacter albus]|uniref:autotransporter domain-containing protein n=1 Tax=Oleisolibacter albus TaxID=2171757 RepID=UPI00138FD1FE|nr:autotransporter domain-containing protein [Oleisolibacter albus]